MAKQVQKHGGKGDRSYWWWILGGGVVGLLLLSALTFREEVVEVINNTFSSHKDFIARIWNALKRAGVGTAQRVVLTAQAIHESGWGVASGSRKGYNYWNITAGPYWKGEVIVGPDTEYDKAGNVKNISQKFRLYHSDDEAVKDFLQFIGPNGRYSAAWAALQAGDAMGYLQALYDKGYYTQPVALYQKAVRDSIRDVVENTEDLG